LADMAGTLKGLAKDKLKGLATSPDAPDQPGSPSSPPTSGGSDEVAALRKTLLKPLEAAAPAST
jgi:hypothetical protein